MGKKSSAENTLERITATYEKDSKRYNRFKVEENDLGIVGTIYFPKDKKMTSSVILDFEKDD